MAHSPTADDSTDLRSTVDDGLGSHSIPRVGIDAEGDRHYYDDEHDRILVVSDGDVDHVEDLDGRSLLAWKAYVRQERGIDIWGDEQFLSQLREVTQA